MKVILVEDESSIRMLLRKIIEQNPGFEIVGEADNVSDGVSLFKKTRADIVFLDIEINGGSGLECAKQIADLEPKTKIIFATAHSEYMSEAFEVYAFDYIMKPFKMERVNQTLERIRKLSEAGKNGDLNSYKKSKNKVGQCLLSQPYFIIQNQSKLL